MGDRPKRRKLRFVTQSPTKYLQQIDSVMTDQALTQEERTHALNNILRDSLRTYGFFTDAYRMIDRAINEALKSYGEGIVDE